LEPLEVRLDEIYPEATNMLQMRVAAWAKGIGDQALELMVGAVQEALKASGV